ncbi:MAG: LysR substrate-binding domain-containing protein [Achromobacter sp.]|nr:LysR substrate-binding domain-containing protein [Achromobacter sp.]
MLKAAAAGLGVGIAPSMLANTDLQSGRLVAPLGFSATGGSFCMFTRTESSKEIDLLKKWLHAEPIPTDSRA